MLKWLVKHVKALYSLILGTDLFNRTFAESGWNLCEVEPHVSVVGVGMYVCWWPSFSPSANTPSSLTHTYGSCLPPGKVRERGMGRGIPSAVSPHPETCQPCRYKPVGIGHS